MADVIEQMWGDAVVVPQRLRDRVASGLRAALIAGELHPGVLYSAPALAARFGVSATPVREAMLGLVREGLVEAVRNKGFRVTGISEHDLDEYTRIRALIEVPTVGEIASSARAERVERLRPLALEVIAAARARDLPRYLEADRRFHLDLLALAGNVHLVEVVADLHTRSRLHSLDHLGRSGRLIASAEEYVELIDLVLAGDRRGAERCMQRHLSHFRST